MTATPIHDELVDALATRDAGPGDGWSIDTWSRPVPSAPAGFDTSGFDTSGFDTSGFGGTGFAAPRDDAASPGPVRTVDPTRPFSMPLTSGDDLSVDDGHGLDGAARAALALAREEATAGGRTRYGTGHLLLGLLRHGDAVSDLLGAAGASVEATRRSLARYEAVAAGGDDDTAADAARPGSAAVAATLAAARRDARATGSDPTGTAGLLAALLEAPVGAAAGVLAALDVPRAELAAAARTLAARPASDAAPRRWRDPSRLVRRRA